MELYHHGILGQKWGVRRYQNKDGTLTDEGRQHLGLSRQKKNEKKLNDLSRVMAYTKATINDRYYNDGINPRSEEMNALYQIYYQRRHELNQIIDNVIKSGKDVTVTEVDELMPFYKDLINKHFPPEEQEDAWEEMVDEAFIQVYAIEDPADPSNPRKRYKL